MKNLISFFVVCLAFFSLSCKTPKAFVYRDLKNFKLEKFGLSQSRVSMDLVFYNPNSYGVDLKKVDCNIYIDSNFVGNFVLDTSMSIPKASEFTLPAGFDVDMKNIFKNSLNLIFHNEVLIGAKGTARMGKGGIFINVPFNYEGKQKLNIF